MKNSPGRARVTHAAVFPATAARFMSASTGGATDARKVALPVDRRHLRSKPITKETIMPKFVIEREIPGAGKMSPADLKTISKKSCGVLSSLGPSVQWIQSYVTADKVYCVYHASDESLVRRHAELGGFPANKISVVATIIDPATAEDGGR
jgi:hypothetical protein